ncbi:uncharacterized protein LOC111620796 [Centruroides sculpturatus]|uniref:uncharacterized protein LOC111620796 n=1 Tax=Centruroides sculpturatus TaxID=218467 RepID=UPI000C6D0BA1|nr:uncharacterized protein LOC111620796 [Centruroides sculpturatus]
MNFLRLLIVLLYSAFFMKICFAGSDIGNNSSVEPVLRDILLNRVVQMMRSDHHLGLLKNMVINVYFRGPLLHRDPPKENPPVSPVPTVFVPTLLPPIDLLPQNSQN